MGNKTSKKEETPKKEFQAMWEKREFALNQHMKMVCELGIAATKAEIASLKRKLKKLQYGA